MRALTQYVSAGYFFPLHGLVIRNSLTCALRHHSFESNCIGVCYYHRHWFKSGKECRALFKFLKVVEI